jgi:hypothetical protein
MKKALTRHEKTLFLLLAISLALLIVKSTMLDSVKPMTPEIEAFRQETIASLEMPPLKVIRMIKFEETVSEGQPAYKGKFRKYLFGIMPYGDYVAIKTIKAGGNP